MGWRIQFVLYFSFLQASSSSDFWKSNKNCHYHYHMFYIFLSFLRPKVLLSLPSVLYFLGISTNWGTLPNSVFCVLLFRVLLFHLIMRFRKSVLWIWCYGFTIPGLVFRVLPLRIWCSGFSVPAFRVPPFRVPLFLVLLHALQTKQIATLKDNLKDCQLVQKSCYFKYGLTYPNKRSISLLWTPNFYYIPFN